MTDIEFCWNCFHTGKDNNLCDEHINILEEEE